MIIPNTVTPGLDTSNKLSLYHETTASGLLLGGRQISVAASPRRRWHLLALDGMSSLCLWMDKEWNKVNTKPAGDLLHKVVFTWALLIATHKCKNHVLLLNTLKATSVKFKSLKKIDMDRPKEEEISTVHGTFQDCSIYGKWICKFVTSRKPGTQGHVSCYRLFH